MAYASILLLDHAEPLGEEKGLVTKGWMMNCDILIQFWVLPQTSYIRALSPEFIPQL